MVRCRFRLRLSRFLAFFEGDPQGQAHPRLDWEQVLWRGEVLL